MNEIQRNTMGDLGRGRYCGDKKSRQRKEQSDEKTDSAGNYLRSSFHYVFGLFEDKTFGLIKKDPQDETTQRQL